MGAVAVGTGDGMITVNAQVIGTVNAIAGMTAAEALIMQGAAVGLERSAALGASMVRGRASGRPGPRVITGDYRRSWTHDTEIGAGILRAQIGTNKPQGPRLEYGYEGPDVLGRVFDQPPYPHVKPVADEMPKVLEDQMGSTIRAVVR